MRIKKLLLATTLLGFALGSNASRPAFAVNSCQTLNGTFCASVNSTTSCTTVDGFPSSCRCTAGHTWLCKL